MQASINQKFVVPTKTYDGGSTEIKWETSLKRRTSASIERHPLDAFFYYSDQDCRMSALLGGSSPQVIQSSLDIEEMTTQLDPITSGEDCHDPNVHSHAVSRRTRISFELHPSLLVGDLLTGTRNEDGEAAKIYR